MKLKELLDQKSKEQSESIEGRTLTTHVSGHKVQVKVNLVLDTCNNRFDDAISEILNLVSLLAKCHCDYIPDDTSIEIYASINACICKLQVLIGILASIHVDGDCVDISWWDILCEMIKTLRRSDSDYCHSKCLDIITYDTLRKDISSYVEQLHDILEAEVFTVRVM